MNKKIENNKVKMVRDKYYFNAPLDSNNKPYWIPIVAKDKSYLLGFINAFHFLSGIHDFSFSEMEIALGSDRFNDVLIDGSRVRNLTREQLKNKIRDIFFSNEETHPENSEDILDEYYLSVSCNKCGMFYPFKTEKEIPEDDLKCDVCGNSIIVYVHEDDEYFSFDGASGDVDKIVDEIKNEK